MLRLRLDAGQLHQAGRKEEPILSVQGREDGHLLRGGIAGGGDVEGTVKT